MEVAKWWASVSWTHHSEAPPLRCTGLPTLLKGTHFKKPQRFYHNLYCFGTCLFLCLVNFYFLFKKNGHSKFIMLYFPRCVSQGSLQLFPLLLPVAVGHLACCQTAIITAIGTQQLGPPGRRLVETWKEPGLGIFASASHLHLGVVPSTILWPAAQQDD